MQVGSSTSPFSAASSQEVWSLPLGQTRFDGVMQASRQIGRGERAAFTKLTDDDRRVLAAVTGVTMDADGFIAKDLHTDDMREITMLFLQVDADREQGRLKENLTSDYFRDVIKNNIGSPNTLPIFNKALDYLLAREVGQGGAAARAHERS